MNIVLDLDETLVSVTTNHSRPYDFSFQLSEGGSGNKITYYAKKRPYLNIFLRFIFKKFQTISIWTAATRDYAQQVIRGIMTPKQIKMLSFVNTRQNLKMHVNGAYTKPLQQVFDFHPSIKKHNTIMIDDRRSVMVENLGNAIIVPAWEGGNSKEQSLVQLIIVLNGLLLHQDKIGLHTHTEVIYLADIVKD